MSFTDQPWFFSDSLSTQFAQDLQDARQAGRITEPQFQWLELLFSPSGNGAKPQRASQISRGDGGLLNAELAGALLISDATGVSTEVYLSTALHGLERFDSRQQLLTEIEARYGQQSGDPNQFEHQLIEGDLFKPRMLAIIEQQVQQLQHLNERLQAMPSLHTALSKTLQKKLTAQFPGTLINPFTHVMQIKAPGSATRAGARVATLRLVDAAMNVFANTPLPAGFAEQWLDGEGQELTADQAKPWKQVLAGVTVGLSAVYEGLLADHWRALAEDSVTFRDLACQAFTERFRQCLLTGRQDKTVSGDEYTALQPLFLPGDSWSDQVRISRLSVRIGIQEPVKLAGIFLIDFISEQLPDLLLYSAKLGFLRFTSMDAVAQNFGSIDGRTRALEYSSLNDHRLLRAHGDIHVRLDPVDKLPFSNLTESIIGLQKRNLANVLTRQFKTPAQACVTIEHDLDIRGLLDPRLLNAIETRQWSEALVDSERNWSEFDSFSRMAGLDIQLGELAKGNGAEATKPWELYLQDARSRIDSLVQVQPSLAVCAHQLLSRYLSVLEGKTVDAHRLWYRDEEGGVVSLSVLLLERMSGARDKVLSEEGEVYFDAADAAYSQHDPWLTPDILRHVLDSAEQGFARAYSRLIRDLSSTRLRVVDSSVIPANASRVIREGLLRLELNLHRNREKISDAGLNMLEQVLNRPVLNLREALGVEAVHVSIPALTHDPDLPAAQLSNVMVVQQPLKSGSRPLLWSALLGLQEFDSLAELRLELTARLRFTQSRGRWLDLIADPDRGKIQALLLRNGSPNGEIQLVPVQGDFLEHLDQGETNRQWQDIETAYRTALEWRADAVLFERMLLSARQDNKARAQIDTLANQMEMSLLSAGIPAWLKTGTIADLLVLRQLLVRFGQLYSSRQRIPSVDSLITYASTQVRQRLQQDFPGVHLDPERLLVTLTRYTSAPGVTGDIPSFIPAATTIISESLTHFAINRLADVQDATLSIASEDATPLPAGLSAEYVGALVRSLDVGAGYIQYLNGVYSETAPDYSSRLEQFIALAPSAMLLVAFQMKMEGVLSETAYAFIQSVMTMPDGLARLPVDGKTVNFSPLKLVSAEGYAADLVAGIYLITPLDLTEGPWILHAPAHAVYFYKEYASQSDLLNDLYTSTPLQALVLERLDPAVRFVYERDGFIQPHLSWASGGFTELSGHQPGPVHLSVEPLEDNVLHCLFRASHTIMVIEAQKVSVTTAQADDAASHFLLMLGAKQTLMFLPGRLGGLVGLWQARDMFSESLDLASQERWGQAALEFAAAVAVLIAVREQTDEASEASSVAVDTSVAPRWHDPLMNVELNLRMQEFEVHDISLSRLGRDESAGVFLDTVSLKRYAAVLGKVYQVKSTSDGWRVTKGTKDGPRIVRDTHQRWTVDTDLGFKQEGGIITRIKATSTGMNVEDMLVVEATGLPELQRLYPRKAAQFVEAHEQARLYLENALHNLTLATPQSQLDPRVARIITDFFGVQALSNVSVIPIKQAFADIYRALLDPSLSPHSSRRCVIGSNKLGYEDSTAFTFANDPQHRIFLTERFFTPPYTRLKPRQLRQGSFNSGAHFRACILIHELSHIAGGTHDIAYVDSTVPYLDLLEDTGAYRARLKLEHQQAQQKLSHLTPRDELFRVDDGEMWRDLKTADGDAKRTILRISGSETLESARDRFIHDVKTRSRIILSNADSVALLVTLLGRQRFGPVN
ncbi:dermonecrotic toxin domain-containing protein [Pseudomonas caspiana]